MRIDLDRHISLYSTQNASFFMLISKEALYRVAVINLYRELFQA